jgi:hypothetical protein
MPGIDNEIIAFVRANGPCTGSGVVKEIDADPVVIWRKCRLSEGLNVRTVGSRYMRLDRHVEGYARLSPSILREFLTYSIMGTSDAVDTVNEQCRALIDRMHAISRRKLELSRQMAREIIEEFDPTGQFDDALCFIIAGDIVYKMAHDVPRPERSTGKLVRGSDIDLVIVVRDDFRDAEIKRLDDIVYTKKHRMLINPAVNEEVDYTIKKVGRIREQCSFDNFRYMVAIKILDEGQLLAGNDEIYGTIKSILEENGLPGKLKSLEERALLFRKKAEEIILSDRADEKMIKDMHLFYSAEEYEEFE